MSNYNKGFKEIIPLYEYKADPNKFILINKVIRFNDEKVAYINARKFYKNEWHPTKGIRIPFHQIQNVIDTLNMLKKVHDEGNEQDTNNEMFKNKHRFSVGPNSDAVISIMSDGSVERIFMHYEPEPGSTWPNKATDSRGVTIPFELVPEIIIGLEKTKSFIKKDI